MERSFIFLIIMILIWTRVTRGLLVVNTLIITAVSLRGDKGYLGRRRVVMRVVIWQGRDRSLIVWSLVMVWIVVELTRWDTDFVGGTGRVKVLSIVSKGYQCKDDSEDFCRLLVHEHRTVSKTYHVLTTITVLTISALEFRLNASLHPRRRQLSDRT